jgi:flagellar motor protein MotB
MGAAFNSKQESKKAPAFTPPASSTILELPSTAPISLLTNEDEKNALLIKIDKLEQATAMLEIAINDSQKIRNALKEKVSETDAEKEKLLVLLEENNQQLTVSKSLNREMSSGTNARTELLETIQRALYSQGIQIEIDTRNGILRLPETLLFDSGKADFRQGGTQALRIVATNLSKILSCYTHHANQMQNTDICSSNSTQVNHRIESVLIEGHTDSQPISNSVFKDNWDLSVGRAKNTYLELTKDAPMLEKLENSREQPLLSFSAYAGRRPITDNSTDAERRKNRRIDIRFIMAPPTIANDMQAMDQIVRTD